MTEEVTARSYVNQADGQQINADNIHGGVNYNYYNYMLERVRKNVEAYALTRDQIARLRDVYVWSPAADRAAGIVRERKAVALTGARGCGRRITSIALLAELGATPHQIVLDPGDAQRELPAEAGCGYIVEIDDQTSQDFRALSSLLAGYRQRLAAAGAYLVITATSETWTTLELRTTIEAVTISPPDPVDVFRSHLRRAHPGAAGRWAGHLAIVEALRGANPADAARLAHLAADVLSGGSDADPVSEALAAYRNWSDDLRLWFGAHEDGYQRALLLAAAALNGADAATVFGAADWLYDRVELPRDPGGGLTGSGASRLLEEVGAQLSDNGEIRLPRPAYPTSVLDYVWEDRPQLRETLRLWLTEFPGTLREPSAQYAGYSLIELAIRQGSADLIRHAVDAWAEQPRCQALAAAALTEAGVSPIGREIRQQMYTWATRAGTTRSLQLTIADVCGGPFGKNFPRNAMTRLRHLAFNGDSVVGERVAEAIGSLAEVPHLRVFALREAVRWATEAGQPRSAGILAFLAIARVLTETLPEKPSPDLIGLLADGWRAALRDANYVAAAQGACEGWLEAAARENAPVRIVLTVLTLACQDSYDIGLLVPAAWRWTHAGQEPTPVPREEIAAQLSRALADRDPLTPGLPTSTATGTTSEEDS